MAGKTISEIGALSIEKALIFSHIQLSDKEFQIATRILKEITDRLSFLSNVGLSYLTIDRTATTLSGGAFSASVWPPRSAPN
ncbi:MAG: hypothetical protein R2874_08180 [Desulfobacterales bacterium]